MKKTLVLLVLVLAACGGDGRSSQPAPEPVQHRPEILNVSLSPDTALYMEGGGSLAVGFAVTFMDRGADISALWVRMPDDTRLTLSESLAARTGTFTEDITIPTDQVGAISVELWLMDQAGYASNLVTTDFRIVADVQDSRWTSRLSGLPGVLSDVVWDGDVFVAVGERGAIYTSADGIDWAAKDSGTDADLHAVAADGPNVVAAGFEVVLLSTDHGNSWAVKDRPTEAALDAVAITASRIVVGGYRIGWGSAFAMVSEDLGDTWTAVDSWPDEDLLMQDLVYHAGMFIAATNGFPGQVAVSPDGKTWSAIEVSDEWAVLRTLIHDGSQFIVAGSWGEIFTSPDGFNWTQLPTPVRDASYTGVAWDGSRLVLAGETMCGLWMCDPNDVPIGLSSADGGITWEVFDIDGDYGSKGLAWGNGRFVSVGEKPVFGGEGAIYTTE